jgi:hypothetical protein
MTDREAPDALIAENGFSMLVTVTKAGYQDRVLFEAGTSPNRGGREHAPAGDRPHRP